jgi:hypothetical protein
MSWATVCPIKMALLGNLPGGQPGGQPTLIYLINKQDGINRYDGKFPINKRVRGKD